MRTTKLLIAAAALAVTSAAIAWPDPPPPPPPPDLNECSPGFWKNHTELWFGFYCTSEEACQGLLANLKKRGQGSGEVRQGVADDLNSWADAYYDVDLCPNDW